MPLARILTLVPEDATPLFRELQRLGFIVEIANPNEEQPVPADLEIEFAVCDQQQVLARASAIAAQLQAEVVVFPGAIPPLPRRAPVVADVPVPAPAFPPTSKKHEIIAPPEPVYENRDLEEERGFGLQLPAGTWLSGMGEKLGALRQRTASGLRTLAQHARTGMQRLKPVLGNGLKKVKNGVSGAGSAIAERTREYQERIRLRTAEARVARKQQLAEMERQSAEMVQQPPVIPEQYPTPAEDVVVSQQQFEIAQAEREKRLAEMERLRAEAREQVGALERARLAAEAEHRKLQQQHSESDEGRRYVRDIRPQTSQLKGVFTGAAAATILFAVGMLLANFHPTKPLPVNMTNGSMDQETPFGGTTVHGPPGVTLGGAKNPKPAPAAKSAPPAAPQLKPQPAKTSAPVAKKKPQPRHFRQRSNQADDGGIADDVVVRHFGPTQKPTAKSTQQQQAGLKHYSDQ